MSQTAAPEIKNLRDLSPHQWKSGIAAWLGWLFDGLDMHLYTLVWTVFVAQLMSLPESAPEVGQKGSIIQAAFLVGWALGGGFFGRLGDVLGRSRALILTILTYAAFTGLSFFAQNWWQLMLCRFLSALGIGGEWAVGASLLSETWPKSWRPWIAAVLQSAVNCGVLLACLAGWLMADLEPRYLFLVGILPALITLWIRKAVPETEAWEKAREGQAVPRVAELFGPKVRSTTWRVLIICGVSLTAHWAFLFWQAKVVKGLPEIAALDKVGQNEAAASALMWIMFGSLIGNFIAGGLAKLMGYRKTVFWMLLAYFAAMFTLFSTTWSWNATLWWFCVIGACQGVFGLFTMCLPPLFPTLLRTTGAGFCYNIGRIIAAFGTVFFGIYKSNVDVREAMYFAAFLFIPAAFIGLLLPEREAVDEVAAPVD
ncbi:MAG: MFS transporter [Verrucomicrobiaceae bacterium]|nr:MFS transporter [Verrucomicrobiaceae bacterium]